MPQSGLAANRIEDALKLIHDFDQAKQASELPNLLS